MVSSMMSKFLEKGRDCKRNVGDSESISGRVL